MDLLSVTASIIAILQLTSKVIEYLNDVKDAPNVRAQCAIEASNLYNLLTTLRYRLEEGASNEPWYQAVRALGVEHGPLDQYKLSLEQLQAKITKEREMKKVGQFLLWKFMKEEVVEIMARIERLKTLVQIALEIDHFKLSQAIGIGVDAIQQDQNRRQHEEILEWISPTNFPAQQSDFIARRQDGTGVWFLDSPKFTEWIHGSKKTLFCPGIPGAGKTMMAAVTIDRLHRTTQSDTIGVTYLYCNYKAQADQSATSLLAAILKQLVQPRPSVTEPVLRLYGHHARRRTRPSLEEIFAALQTALKSFSSVYVVIDALDECSDRDGTRSQLLAKLRDLQREADLRLMVTSRFILDIENDFRSIPTLEIRASSADVKQFVRGQIHRLPKCVQRDHKLQGFVEDKIVKAVAGMFLLARLYVDSLLDKRTKAKVLSTLEKLSSGSKSLDEAYDDAIKRIEAQLPEDSALAKTVLSWITYAKRPLTTGELCHALAVEPGEEDLNKDNVLDVEDIVSVCAGLVTVDEESNIIRLVHYTTQEYFERVRENWNPTALQEITTTCLTYLSFNTFRSGSCPSDKEFESSLEQNKFLGYATLYWGQHAQIVQEQVSELALSFLQDAYLVSSAVQVMSTLAYKYPNYTRIFPKRTTGLHLTARFGLLYLSEVLLSQLESNMGISADSKDSYGRTPLSQAAERGQEAVVKLLIERDDVEANSKDNNGMTPLSKAAERGHEAVVKLFSKRNDVEADSKDKNGMTPLSWAARNGRETVVKLLVERDNVKADSKNNKGRTPLSQATERGHEAVVKLLVERDDVEANSKNNNGMTPLSWAALSGHEAVVKLLVERDDVKADIKNNDCITPLSWAAGRGREAVVKLLIERDDVEADSKDKNGWTPLSKAAHSGHEAVVKLLVERDDVKADSKDNNGMTPLSKAAHSGHEAVVKLLVERDDVEADSKDKNGQTPLLRAAHSGHEAVVKLLVERDDVEADSKDKDGRTPLSKAAHSGHEAVVKLLVERDDVEVDSRDNNGMTPLSWAALSRQEAVVKLLRLKFS